MKLEKLIFRNLGLKVIALVFATMLWFLVTNINDPVTTLQFTNVQVKLLNTSLITNRGEVYSVLDNTDVIPVVVVTAPRSVIDSLGADNIVATADVQDMSTLDTVGITLSTNKYNNEITNIEGSIDAVRLNIEEKKTKSIALQIASSGEVADGYILSEITPEQNQVRISGAESVVDSVSTASVTVDVSGATANINTSAEVRLYDDNDELINTAGLTMNISSVKVSATVLPVKEVSLTVETSGTPAAGYMATGEVTAEPASVKLAGRSAALAKVETITIPAEELDLTDAQESVTKTIDIRNYLPEGVFLADNSFNGQVQVTAVVEPIATKTVEFSLSDVALNNIPEGYTAQIASTFEEDTEKTADTKLKVSLQGLSEELDQIGSGKALKPSVDVSSLISSSIAADKSGNYTATVGFTLTEHVKTTGSLQVRVRLQKQDTDAQEDAADSSSTGNSESSTDDSIRQ